MDCLHIQANWFLNLQPSCRFTNSGTLNFGKLDHYTCVLRFLIQQIYKGYAHRKKNVLQICLSQSALNTKKSGIG